MLLNAMATGMLQNFESQKFKGLDEIRSVAPFTNMV